jgi:hypothetical protein
MMRTCTAFVVSRKETVAEALHGKQASNQHRRANIEEAQVVHDVAMTRGSLLMHVVLRFSRAICRSRFFSFVATLVYFSRGFPDS